MEISHSIQNQVCILSIIGDLDASIGNEFKDYLRKLTYDTNIKTILIDFSQTNYIDSSGIGTIIMADFQLKKRDASLALTAVSTNVYDIIDMCGVRDQLSIFTKTKDALHHYNSI